MLIIFTKNPELGKVKTRLAKDLGDQKALQVFQILLEHSQKITLDLEVDKQVWYSSKICHTDKWDSLFYEKRLQKGKDLGERMENAFRAGFDEGYEQIVIIGTDLYELTALDIQMAFQALDDHEYVIGPAKDGGYYLLGMKYLNSKLFQNKRWSTSSVYKDSLADMGKDGIKTLRKQNDIDVLDDIKQHPAFQKFINL